MGQDAFDVEIGEPLLQQVGLPGLRAWEEPAGLQVQPEHGAGDVVGFLDGHDTPASAMGRLCGAYGRSFQA